MGKPHSALAASAVAEQVSMVLSLKGSQELHSAPFSHQPWCRALPPQEDWWFTTSGKEEAYKETSPSIKTCKRRGHPALKTLHRATVVYSKGRGRGAKTAFTTPEGRCLPKHEDVALISSPNGRLLTAYKIRLSSQQES